MKAKKTVQLKHMVVIANDRLKDERNSQEYKKAVCDFLETMLLNNRSFMGYSYLNDENNGVDESNFYNRKYY
jgi:hypothetical protein